MKTKKAKAAKLGKKNRGISDVSPSTSLPPLVEGQVQCFLRIAVSKILWIVPRPPASPLVRLRWWGETSNGTQFRPRDASHAEQKSAKTIARYAVRCGPKQFTSYLTDMGTLVLEVMTKPDHLPIGRVQINGISQLSPTYGISGFFTVISPTSEKLGELQVSLALESLSESCDSSSSIPNTDASVDGAVSAQSSAVLLTSRTGSFENLIEFSAPRKSSITSASGKESLSSSTCNTPRGRDHVYFQENAKITKTVSSEKKQPLSSAPYVPAETLEAAGERIEARVLSTDSQTTKNLISVLLDRGSKLRNAMVISAMKTVPNGMSGLVDSPYMVPCEDIGMSKSKKLPSHSGKLLHNLLESEDTCPTNDSLQFSPGPLKEVHPNTDATAIGLLLGSTDSIPLHYWDGMGSPPESPSAGSSVLDESELNDPHYDQSLLEHLFYKDPKYESSGSEFTSDDEELDISKKKLRQQSHHKADIRNQQGLSHLASDCSIIDLTQNEAVKTIGSYPVLEGPPLAEQEMQAIELSVDRLTLLGRIYLARVIIETLKLPPDSAQTTPKQKGSRGKPPRPVPGRKCTYFVEYHFPVATPSRGAARGVSMTSEITRVASSKVTSEAVKFQQRFVFPICFNGLMIERWWNSDLLFKIYSRKSTQKKPILIGTASLALRSIIQSDLLNITSELPVEMVCDNKEKQKQIGPLKVSVELAADNKDLTSANARLAASPKATYVVSSPRANLASEPKGVDVCPMDLHPVGPHAPDSSSKRNKPQLKQSHVQDMLRNDHSEHSYPSSVPGGQHLFRQFSSSVEDEEGFLLHVLLMVPDGKDFVMGDGTIQQQHSIYLKCKLFSTDEATRSPVSWSTSRPIFNFSLVAPITLTPRLLERMKNNMMIIEIWNKVSNTGQEKLLGLVKLPLHQFYLSFRDPKISHLLFQAQYPVVAVDSYMPMMDVFTGCQRGSLRVLLAMGEANQIVELQRLKNEAGTAVSVFQRTPHFLEQVASVPSKLGREETESLMEHIFEINVVQLKGLTPLQSTVWGEADCYIQYYFPTLEADTITETLPIVNDIILKPFRTATTLCVPDPLFNDCRSHSLLIPPDLPVQRILLNACSKQKSTGGGGLQFEVWCRYYYPNVRDQVVARGVLPLSKLCAMVTMQHHKEVGVQTFGIPLMPRIENEGHAACSAGLLDVSVRYRCSVQSTEDAGNGVIASRAVSLSVQLLRASGLQAAARAAAERSHSLKYQSEIGVNTYITIHISFLENEKRRTKVVARTFCPEFDHYSEFPCNILIQRSTGESFSLAELLESSEAVFTIYHQSTTPAKPSTILIGASRDVVLGTVRIPLASLLTRRTGISGWYAVSLPEIPASAQSCGALQNLGGGLEISIHFAHPNDRERVVKAAETLGWKYGTSGEEGKEGQSPESSISITLTVSRIWLPLHSVVLAGRAHLDKSTFCYLRYKLYDREAICTSLQKPVLTVNESYATVNFDQATTIYLKRTQSLIWYLKEERLEVQAWLAFGKDNKTLRPCDTDRLIGYSFIDLSTLAEKPLRKLTVSGVYPLFKRGASDLSGAALRFHITLAPHDRLSSTGDYTSPRICDVEDDHDYAHDTKENVPSINEKEQMSDGHIVKEMSTGFNIECQKVVNEISEVDLANTFAVNVVVERAMHLSLKGCPLTEQTIVKPSCYVSYATPVSPTPITTQLIENAYSPVWDHQQQTRLPKELLLDPQQTLVFKVWHKADIDRVIGFATVDLSALLSGFLTICGWYNITDFSGQCQGQLKVAITPLENIHHLREKRSTQTHKQVAGSASILESLSYRTSGMYNSFPSHISKYSEQFITSLNADATSANDRSANTEIQTSRHEEHMKNIRRFHQSLQNTGFSESLSQTSRTSLFSALRRNLSELDDIQRYFSQKLSTSPFSQMVNPTPAQRADENTMNYHHRSSSSGDEQRLLEKSKKLVSETRHFINGLQESTKADVTSPTQSSRATEDWVKIAENEPQRLENERNKSQCEVFPYVQSPERENLKTQICIQGNSELGHIKLDEYFDQEQISSQNNRSNVENGNHQNDDSSEEGYEEDVIQPRILNDMTVMTDRTSPWSSILSEFEDNYKHECEGTRETHEPIGNGIQAEEKQAIPVYVHDELFTKRVQNKNCHLPGNIATGESPPSARFSLVNEGINLDIPDTNLILQSEQYSEIELLEIQSSDDRDLFSSNPDEAEDLIQENGDVTECNIFPSGEFPLADREKGGLKVNSNHEDYRHNNTNREIEIQELFKRQNHEGPQFSEAGGECVQRRCEESSDTDSSEDTHSVRLSDPVVIPNFFLPPSHLEASMRVLNVAQSIHRAATNHSEVSSLIRTRRSNRQKPRLASTELPKEETERIAKIFAGRFVEKS